MELGVCSLGRLSWFSGLGCLTVMTVGTYFWTRQKLRAAWPGWSEWGRQLAALALQRPRARLRPSIE